MKQNRIAITGGIGSGKSTVSKILSERGYAVIDCDEITAEIYQKAETAKLVAEVFGGDFVVDGQVDKKKLGAFVFGNKSELEKLNNLLHPVIFKMLEEKMKDKGEIVFVQIPLLIETNMQFKFDRVWLVTAAEQTKVSRVVARDAMNEQLIKDRMENQLSDEIKSTFAHTIIHNDTSEENLKKIVLKCVEELNFVKGENN